MLSAIDKTYAFPVLEFSPSRERLPAADQAGGAHLDRAAAVVELSPEAQRYLQGYKDSALNSPAALSATGSSPYAKTEKGDSSHAGRLSEADQQKVMELKKEDQRVRAHEQQHLAASGGFARGGPHFEYTTGPDGNQYAVAGHVDIDTSPVPGDPAATLQKAQTVQRAALAPADPSGADRAVAAQAAQMEMQARLEMEQPATASSTTSSRGHAGACCPGCGCAVDPVSKPSQ